MISKKMGERLNAHLNEEFFAFYQYLALSAYCHSRSLTGFAHWFLLQAQEEQAHAMKFYNYLLDQDCDIALLPIKQPACSFNSVLEAAEKALANEQHVTKQINDLFSFALEEKDHATHIFLHWFVTEQVEEEANFRDLIERLKLGGESGEALLLLDRELGARQPEPAE